MPTPKPLRPDRSKKRPAWRLPTHKQPPVEPVIPTLPPAAPTTTPTGRNPISPDLLPPDLTMPRLPSGFPTGLPDFPEFEIPEIPQFRPSDYAITDIFAPQTALPQLSVEEHKQYMENLQGWNRAIDVGTESLKTNKRMVDMGTLSLEGQLSVEKYGRKQVDLQTERVKTVQSGIKYQMEVHKTQGMQYELNGAARAVPLIQQKVEARLQQLQQQVYELQLNLGKQVEEIPSTLPAYTG